MSRMQKRKGVSPVIASVLMVMIAVGLIAFAYSWFTAMARQAKAAGSKHMGEMEKTLQDLEIVTATYVSSANKLCFQIKAPLTNSITVPLGPYITYVVDTNSYNSSQLSDSLTGCPSTGTNCKNKGGLEPGEECYGAIGYSEYPSFFEIKHDWGAHEVATPEYK